MKTICPECNRDMLEETGCQYCNAKIEWKCRNCGTVVNYYDGDQFANKVLKGVKLCAKCAIEIVENAGRKCEVNCTVHAEDYCNQCDNRGV